MRIPLFGNPMTHAFWQDEAFNKDLKGIAGSVHGATFEKRILLQANYEEGLAKKQRKS